MSGGEAIREEKRLGRRSDSDTLRRSSTDLSKSPRILSPFESLCHSPVSLRIALSLPCLPSNRSVTPLSPFQSLCNSLPPFESLCHSPVSLPIALSLPCLPSNRSVTPCLPSNRSVTPLVRGGRRAD